MLLFVPLVSYGSDEAPTENLTEVFDVLSMDVDFTFDVAMNNELKVQGNTCMYNKGKDSATSIDHNVCTVPSIPPAKLSYHHKVVVRGIPIKTYTDTTLDLLDNPPANRCWIEHADILSGSRAVVSKTVGHYLIE